MIKRFGILLILLLALGSMNTFAQTQPTITITVPSFWEVMLDDAVVEQFENDYGVQVKFVYGDANISLPANADEVGDYLTTLTDYVSSADVLYVSPDNLTPEATRAGFFLDLMPLVSADSRLDASDFHPAVWDSYMWDSGMWAVPTSANVMLVDYVPEAFDAAGLIYPDANWTIDDYINAARELTQYDEAGNVTVPGLLVNDGTALLRSLLGSDFTNSSTFPTNPSLTNPQLTDLLETWLDGVTEGIITDSVDFDLFNQIPIRVGTGAMNIITVAVRSDDEDAEQSNDRGPRRNFFDEGPQRTLAPLPGNTGGVNVNGFAISSGSSQPQLAYELVRYLSEQQVIATAGGAEPARYSYDTPERVGNGPVVIINGGNERTPEETALVQQVLDSGLNPADLRFGHYLANVLERINSGDLTVDDALQQSEADALAVMEAMDNADLQITVAQVEPTILAEGEIALNFGLQSFMQPLPNQADWDTLVADFVAQDPEVGAINLNSGFKLPDQFITDNDCAYLVFNAVEDLSDQLLPLDPLVFSDANYSLNDVPANAVSQLQLNGMMVGLPMTLTPDVLIYKLTAFANAGLAEPTNGWTMDEFIDALQQLDSVLAEDEAPFMPQGPSNTYLLMLIAAQGGLPIDFTTDPITLDFTSPETVAAVQTVLDLAKNGYIDYQALGQFGGGRGVFITDDVPPGIAATSFLAGRGGGRRRTQEQANSDETLITTYPTGTTYTPVAYEVGGGYINADTQYPEACYRWLSYLANHPYVLNTMPALLTTLSQPELTTALGEDTVTTYQRFADMMTAANSANLTATDFFVSQWLNQAFDAYVLEDADLLTALQDAEQLTRDYLECTANLAPDASMDNFATCADNVNGDDS